ncbi:hypothetical protein KXD98_00945 [Mycobacterium sp. SMC-4]|nr:hypothetical protein KXD98_00945 [Mycobacterium sp. SMC-4]
MRGRPGVGRHTVAAALAAAGVTVAGPGPAEDPPDVTVVVVAETAKPEDLALLRDGGPALMVLNKADLGGAGAGGPVTAAQHHAAELAARLRCDVVAMVAHLAVVDLDETLLAALRSLIDEPADMTSVDAFVASDHRLAPAVRAQLLAALDRFGLAHAVLGVADGATAPTLTTRLRALSGVQQVVAALETATAPLRYHAICAAQRELRLLAARTGDEDLEQFLRGDDVVIAAMAAAVDVVHAAGIDVDRGTDRAAHLRRAVYWRRYARGPVDRLHAACAADISRGSLRLLAGTS